MRLIEFENRSTDWMRRRGRKGWLRIGPFVFQVNTADGLDMAFSIVVGRWAVCWSVEEAA
jgi:hypothetical protein